MFVGWNVEWDPRWSEETTFDSQILGFNCSHSFSSCNAHVWQTLTVMFYFFSFCSWLVKPYMRLRFAWTRTIKWWTVPHQQAEGGCVGTASLFTIYHSIVLFFAHENTMLKMLSFFFFTACIYLCDTTNVSHGAHPSLCAPAGPIHGYILYHNLRGHK